MDIRIPKHVEEKDAILGLYLREWVYMIPFVAAVYGIALVVHVIVLKVVLMVLFLGAPWHFMAQRSLSGRRNAMLIVHRFKASKRQKVFRARMSERTLALQGSPYSERESERVRSKERVNPDGDFV